MIAVMLIAAGMCLQGGEQVDVSRYVSATARLLELKVTLKPANGTVVVYSPGYEEQQVEFSQELSFGWIPFAKPVLCIRSMEVHLNSTSTSRRSRMRTEAGSGAEPVREEQS